MVYVADTSNNNPGVEDFDAVRRAGYGGVILKASEGLGFADPYFADRARAAYAAGLVVGGYHFGHPGLDAGVQARLFGDVVASAKVPVLIRCADIEVAEGNPDAWAHAFCPEASINLLYSGLYFALSELAVPIPGVAWWIASYGTAVQPRAPWGQEAGWQFTSGGSVPGIPGAVDVSMFGDAAWASLTSTQEEDVMLAQEVDPETGGTWTVKPDGSVWTDGGAPYLGGLNNHPEWSAGGTNDPAVGVTYWKGDGTNGGGLGYKITTLNAAGNLAYYRFPRDARYAATRDAAVT